MTTLTEFTMVKGFHKSLALEVESRFSKASKILDLGAGAGAWIERLGNSGFQNLYGVDKSAEYFQASKGKFIVADLDYGSLNLDNEVFDLITSIEVIEHLENPGRLFQHVSTLLAPSGYFLLTTPNLHSVLCRMRLLLTGNLRQFDAKGEPTHIYPVFLAPLERLLALHGLEITEKWTFPKTHSVTSRPSLKLLSLIAKLFIKDELQGDILCLWIQRKSASGKA
ncbi:MULTISPECIES: class I SAM-dependent methyltransferase [Cyanophyceae]|uniref:class I SAM-dependent methyltransferase n=1 Tax=Cyanophyceae TaxID=3028117 RepID=UPI0016864EE0|nr:MULTISPECIES: class I SAM-dependent methyltransferase [Cyanophyceae]MBD1916321.1 class I SAM-dependent methyltransferase [Phormidium sp. FACHB-77]MBD2032613.1 class I SAM-dependent methyltransferase [Phormidium sp. FACHB-322]MBD2049985.1 class I SAM-dependent methyltransferase [Leptolyngbya sp. FACHB-60]